MSFAAPTWVEVHGQPRTIFYARALESGLGTSFGSGYPALPILLGVAPLRQKASDDEGPENPSTAFEIDNSAGQAAAALARPPLGARAVVKGIRRTIAGDATVTLFEGVVTEISIGLQSATLRIQT